MAGLGIGVLSGLVLALALFLFMGSYDLIGLMHGGSPAYRYSVSQSLGKLAWRIGTSVAPLTMGIVVIWAIWRKAGEASAPVGEVVSVEEPGVQLRLGLRHLAVWGLLAAISAILATVLRLFSQPRPLRKNLVFLGAGGLPVLGPWIGPVINPGDGCGFPRALNCVAAPVMLIAAAPFLFRLGCVPRVATVCSCGFFTALLGWLAAGIFSALHAMG